MAVRSVRKKKTQNAQRRLKEKGKECNDREAGNDDILGYKQGKHVQDML